MSNLKGVGVALVTPFNEDLSVDFDSLTRLVEYNIEKWHQLFSSSRNHSRSCYSFCNRKTKVIKHVIKINNKRLPLVLGIGGNNTLEVKNKLKKLI